MMAGGVEVTRKDFLGTAAMTTIINSVLGAGRPSPAAAAAPGGAPPPSPRPLFWGVGDESPPNMQPYTKIGEQRKMKEIAEGTAVYLGEHHNSAADHELQARLLGELRRARGNGRVAVGLEMVQQRFQPVLDDYISGKVPDLEAADAALYEGTEWETRWNWSFDNYKPVLHFCRENKLPLVALNVDSEVMAKVRKAGLDGLSGEERRQYVSDPQGFINAVRDPGFKLYSDAVILSSFEDHVDMGIYPATPEAQRNFFAGRILWDEAMADRAARYARDHPDTLMAVLIGADHVKFGFGSAWRLDRLLNGEERRVALKARADAEALQEISGRAAASSAVAEAKRLETAVRRVTTVLLNPTAEDTLSASRGLRLKLGTDEEREALSRPLSDYLAFSASPAVGMLTRPQNPANN